MSPEMRSRKLFLPLVFCFVESIFPPLSSGKEFFFPLSSGKETTFDRKIFVEKHYLLEKVAEEHLLSKPNTENGISSWRLAYASFGLSVFPFVFLYSISHPYFHKF